VRLVPDEETRVWLLRFWDARGLVTPLSQCPTPLVYEDGSEGRCVLARNHTDPDLVPVDVPHADKDGRLADKLVHRATILDVRRVERLPPLT
jgi:hypothetical protein